MKVLEMTIVEACKWLELHPDYNVVEFGENRTVVADKESFDGYLDAVGYSKEDELREQMEYKIWCDENGYKA